MLNGISWSLPVAQVRRSVKDHTDLPANHRCHRFGRYSNCDTTSAFANPTLLWRRILIQIVFCITSINQYGTKFRLGTAVVLSLRYGLMTECNAYKAFHQNTNGLSAQGLLGPTGRINSTPSGYRQNPTTKPPMRQKSVQFQSQFASVLLWISWKKKTAQQFTISELYVHDVFYLSK